jgi:hypothetical protein
VPFILGVYYGPISKQYSVSDLFPILYKDRGTMAGAKIVPIRDDVDLIGHYMHKCISDYYESLAHK